jgi:prepilin-type N-terminal cleavage/methylation domain-containing protein/prepilin-type processing-associated H-X9-DG protein
MRRAERSAWQRASAFTLVELLTVVAILSVLLTILMPAIAGARRLAQRAVCLSHLHGVGKASVLYAAENKNFVPWGNRVLWFQAFLPYVGSGPRATDYRNVRIYRCPAYPDKRQTVCFVASAWTFSKLSDTVGRSIDSPRNLQEFDRPFATLYLADNEDGPWRQIITNAKDPELSRQDVWNPGHLPASTSQDITYGRRVARSRHDAGCNGTFLDGHAAWVRATAMTVNLWRDKWR